MDLFDKIIIIHDLEDYEKEALNINTSNLSKGIYLIKTSEGIVKKLIID